MLIQVVRQLCHAVALDNELGVAVEYHAVIGFKTFRAVTLDTYHGVVMWLDAVADNLDFI